MVNISKQGHYKQVKTAMKRQEQEHQIIESAKTIRAEHKGMGCRKMYGEIPNNSLGRDRTEALLLNSGFRLKRRRNYRRTTYAGLSWYPNLISGKQMSKVNQLWVSDITYVPIGYKKFYYLTLILDVYNRKIVGWSLSKTLRWEDTVKEAYNMAIRGLTKQQCEQLIFHSDRGSQYVNNEMRRIHREKGTTPSSGGKAWENAHAESLNSILKNEYIDFLGLDLSLNQAKKLVKQIVYKYNYKRPHGSLKNMKPVEFENFVQGLALEQKPIFRINY